MRNLPFSLTNSIILLLRGDAEITFQDVFKLCIKLTTDSTIQWFQYKIFRRLLQVKNNLEKIKVTDNDSCTFCGNDTETIEHIFATYTFTLALWNLFSIHIYNATSERFRFDVVNIIFRECPLQKANKVIIFLIVYGKQYIYPCSIQNKLPNLTGLLCHLKMKYEIEK